MAVTMCRRHVNTDPGVAHRQRLKIRVPLTTMFGIGCVPGTKAGGERYEQLCKLARSASENFDATSARQRLEGLVAQLDDYFQSNSRRTSSKRRHSWPVQVVRSAFRRGREPECSGPFFLVAETFWA